MKKTGILLPVFSLPGSERIGTLGREAYAFIDFLSQAKQDFWQMLPIHPTGYGDSPYQSFSAYAGNPYFIDLEELVKLHLLKKNDLIFIPVQPDHSAIDYESLFYQKIPLLKKAYQNHHRLQEEYDRFKKKNRWVHEYGLFMALKEFFHHVSWIEWPMPYRFHEKKALQTFYLDHQQAVEEYIFMQFLFFRQWDQLKKYARKKKVQLIGDIPIYVAYDSADVWSSPSLFQLDENRYPTKVAGVPPDYFSATGQLWGNPLYRYDKMKKNHYRWWVSRIRHAMKLFDVLRIDHFRGFSAYYAIPYPAEDATRGTWEEGPGFELFEQLNKRLNKPRIIAENLGLLDEKVDQLIEKTDYPGMKILEFELTDLENIKQLKAGPDHCFLYPGTHDNDTFIGWYQKLPEETRQLINREFHYVPFKDQLSEKLRAYCYGLPQETVIFSMQDILGLDSFARINVPGSVSFNWQYRFSERKWNKKLADQLALQKQKWQQK